ncbi:MAG: bifunctional oligoribonuclease/PAP phosphatase NrnA [Clostridia bacterium]|nr:bifunctional oligoribonuclease/PAP phosphatase NrnA [Clostridia bacterium]
MNKALLSIIEEHEEILLLPHVSPDGDTLGSTFALNAYLKRLGKKTHVVLNDDVPSNLMFLVDDHLHKEADYDALNATPTLVFAIDSSDPGRLDSRQKYLEGRVSVCIDHHITNTKYCDHNYVTPEASSTGEVLYELLFTDDMTVPMEIASAIYVAILMDTGSFRYSNTSSRTMEIVARLFSAGIDYVDLNIAVYQNVPIDKFRFTNMVLSTLELSHDNQVGFIYITEEMLAAAGLSMQDTDGIIENIRDIASIEVALFAREVSPNVFKASARSKRFYDVATFCLDFGGGGHVRAAGCTIKGSLSDVRNQLLSAIEL